MIELIITIVSLSLLLISLLAYCIVTHRRHELDLHEWRDGYDALCDKLAASQEDYVTLLEKYSSSIDKHAAAYDDILNRCKKLELELDAKDLEIDRLNQGPTNRIYRDLLSSKCSDCKYCKEDCYALIGECIAFNKFVHKEASNEKEEVKEED